MLFLMISPNCFTKGVTCYMDNEVTNEVQENINEEALETRFHENDFV